MPLSRNMDARIIAGADTKCMVPMAASQTPLSELGGSAAASTAGMKTLKAKVEPTPNMREVLRIAWKMRGEMTLTFLGMGPMAAGGDANCGGQDGSAA